MNRATGLEESFAGWLRTEDPGALPSDVVRDAIAQTLVRRQRRRMAWGFGQAAPLMFIGIVLLVLTIAALMWFGAQPAPAPRYQGEFVPAPIPGDDGSYHRLGVLLGDGRVLLLTQGGTNFIYDPATATFSVTGSTPRRMMIMATATALSDGRVLAIGEDLTARNADRPGDFAAIFDPVTGRFSPTATPTRPHGQASAAVLLHDGRVALVGGAGGVRNGTTSAQADVFDPLTSRFVAAGAMSIPRLAFTATLLTDGHVLVVGGRTGPDGQVATALVESFDPDSLSFAPAGSMTTPRAGHSATLLTDGRVLIAGGMDTDFNAIASSEIYDPATGAFTAAGPMGIARVYQTATRLTDGTVLIAGGARVLDPLTAMASAEIYDPPTDSFAPTGSMITEHFGANATRLRDGTVLVAGGGDAEVYR
jgi:hypothetical protein